MSCDDKSRGTGATLGPSAAQGWLEAELRACLTQYVVARGRTLREVAPAVAPLADAATVAVGGGKLLRGSLCFWAWRGAGGRDDAAVLAAAAAVELFHAGALVHDDVMDRSDERRGRPTSHLAFARLGRESGLVGDDGRFGDSAAVLLGDLLMTWAGDLLARCEVPPARLADARAVFDLMRTEAMGGQYLDLWEQAHPRLCRETSERVLAYKSAKYSGEQPLLLGATLAGASSGYREGVAALGRDVGEAFQLRDDVLGVFGDPNVTGKPVGDDLRDRKKTVLLVLAHERSTPAGRARIERCLGPGVLTGDDVGFLEEAIVATGALATVERRIDELRRRAVERVQDLVSEHGLGRDAQDALVYLAGAAAQRVA